MVVLYCNLVIGEFSLAHLLSARMAGNSKVLGLGLGSLDTSCGNVVLTFSLGFILSIRSMLSHLRQDVHPQLLNVER